MLSIKTCIARLTKTARTEYAFLYFYSSQNTQLLSEMAERITQSEKKKNVKLQYAQSVPG